MSSTRLLSRDFFRGLTRFLLVAEGTELWWTLVQGPIRGTFWNISSCNLSIIPDMDCVSGKVVTSGLRIEIGPCDVLIVEEN